MSELKPCPFCGSAVNYNFDMEFEPIGVFCPKCYAAVRFTRIRPMVKNRTVGSVLDDITEAWNRREKQDETN